MQKGFYFILFEERKEKSKKVKVKENSTYTSLSALVTDVFITCEFFTIQCTIFYNYKYLACKKKLTLSVSNRSVLLTRLSHFSLF